MVGSCFLSRWAFASLVASKDKADVSKADAGVIGTAFVFDAVLLQYFSFYRMDHLFPGLTSTNVIRVASLINVLCEHKIIEKQESYTLTPVSSQTGSLRFYRRNVPWGFYLCCQFLCSHHISPISGKRDSLNSSQYKIHR